MTDSRLLSLALGIKGIFPTHLSKLLGVRLSTIKRWISFPEEEIPPEVSRVLEALAELHALPKAEPEPGIPVPADFGGRIVLARLKAGIPRKRFAQLAGVGAATVVGWEQGQVPLPKNRAAALRTLERVEAIDDFLRDR